MAQDPLAALITARAHARDTLNALNRKQAEITKQHAAPEYEANRAAQQEARSRARGAIAAINDGWVDEATKHEIMKHLTPSELRQLGVDPSTVQAAVEIDEDTEAE